MRTYYTGTSGTVKYDGGLFYDVTNWELTAELVPIEATTLADVAPRYRYARPIYAGRMNVIPANASKFETDAKRITTDLFRTAVSPSTALHELTLTTGAGDHVTTYRCRAAFSDVQFQNGVDGRPQLSIGFLVDDLLLDANWDTTESLIISTGSFALTTVPVTFDYFQTNFGTLELDLTFNPIDLRYFSGALTTLALSLTMRPIELRYFALDLTTQEYTVTYNDLDLSLASSDPFFSSTELLLKGEGIDDGTVITDSSSNARTVQINNGAVTSTDEFKFGSSSIYFSNTNIFNNTRITYAISSSDYFALGDFTIEMFFRISSFYTTTLPIFLFDTGSANILSFDATGSIFYRAVEFAPATAITTGTWYHLAVSRVSGTTKVFLDGTQIGSDYADAKNYSSLTWVIGSRTDGQRGFFGYIDELRITKGVGRYTSNFTPPTATFPEQ